MIEKRYHFSNPEILERQQQIFISVKEADLNSIHDQWPVLPVNITTFEFPLGTIVHDVQISYPRIENISIPYPVSYGSCSTVTAESEEIYTTDEMYPSSHVSYHLGGGIYNDEYSTLLTISIYPVTYTPKEDLIHFVDNITIKIIYEEPTDLFIPSDRYDLLIIAPQTFENALSELVDHKNSRGIRTKLITLDEIEEEQDGRDLAEKIKYQIKQEIERNGIDSVLLVGGRNGQKNQWILPVRYSHVLIREGTQEIVEPEFISDLYFADIYDSNGEFSSWDSNNNDVFAEFDEGFIDEMDLYPDVSLGRIPCRNTREVGIMVDKIIAYETMTRGSDWFDRILLISGDHWADEDQINEGVLIMDEAANIMDDFTPVKIYAEEDKLMLTSDIRKAFNQGAGFAYFCGHGSTNVWGIHYPPDATGWAPTQGRLGLIPFYKNINMNFLRNKQKLPVALVGGCNNGQFDVSMIQSILQGNIRFTPHCWAWHLTIQKNGGSIATIANTGLGTHAMDDNDNNGINDYLEIYDGWLELKFLQTYQQDNIDVLGEIKLVTITQYLNRFLGAGDEMDIKMIQQWQLFGDPSLKIGGYRT
jgi:hypothetical protein